MPELTDTDIETRIADGRILGLSIDTDVFDQFGCNLDFTTLQKLDQFRNGVVQVFLSEIVVCELANHISRDATEAQRSLKTAMRKLSKRWKRPIDFGAMEEALCLEADPTAEAYRQVQGYMNAVGAQIVPASDLVDVSAEVLRRYFNAEAPFDSNEKKKYEFPDAFALLTLEEVAIQNGYDILCVSKDKGWLAFAAQSDHLICVDNLAHALSLFSVAERTTADQAMTLWRAGQAAALERELENAFEYRLSDNDYLAEANSNFEIEVEPISAVMQYVDLDNATAPVVISADDEEITFVITLPALVEYEANVHFYAYNRIDKDLVSLTDEIFTETQTDKFQIAITVPRQIENELDVHSVDIAKHRLVVDFGEVDPFLNENPEHEKY